MASSSLAPMSSVLLCIQILQCHKEKRESSSAVLFFPFYRVCLKGPTNINSYSPAQKKEKKKGRQKGNATFSYQRDFFACREWKKRGSSARHSESKSRVSQLRLFFLSSNAAFFFIPWSFGLPSFFMGVASVLW